MRKFLIKVDKQQYEVEIEEIKVNKISKSTGDLMIKTPSPIEKRNTLVDQINKHVASPMAGSILKVNVIVGEYVKRGHLLMVLEAMKMENEITSHVDGKISSVKIDVGQVISAGEILVEFE